MNQRDKNILKSLKEFRALSRDQIIQLHFSELKNSVAGCNLVLKRLQRDGRVICDPTRRPYIYFSSEVPIKINSSKLPHFLAIADFYIEALEYGDISEYEVEPKLGKKGTVEPDLFMAWNGLPLFVEIQRSNYSKKQMDAKMDRYKAYYRSDEWTDRFPKFPGLIIIDDKVHDIEARFTIYQAKNMEDLKKKYQAKPKLPEPIKSRQPGGISVQIK